MSPKSHIYHEIYLHFNWHCHEDRPLIVPGIEERLYELIEEYCRKYRGVYFKRLGGTETHVHLIVQVEPMVCPSEFIGKVKGFSAHQLNKSCGAKRLQWQKGYGVASFAKKNLPSLIRYVDQQKAHHAKGTANAILERWGDISREAPEEAS